MQEFFKQNLMPAGNFFGMYLNSPGQVKEEELQWRLGFPVPADAAVAAPLLKGECKATKIAVYLHVGPYDKVGDAYGKIFEFIEKSGYKAAGPTMEKYLDMDPAGGQAGRTQNRDQHPGGEEKVMSKSNE